MGLSVLARIRSDDAEGNDGRRLLTPDAVTDDMLGYRVELQIVPTGNDEVIG